MIVLALVGFVLGLVAAIGNRLQRDFGNAAARMAGGDQLREAVAVLPLDLRALASAAGDIHAGEARDASLQVSLTVASAIVCSATGDAVVLAPFAAGDGEPAGTTVTSGDSLWVLVDSDSGEAWHGMSAAAVASAPQCNALATLNTPTSPLVPNRSYAVTVGTQHAALATVGAPVRITRPLRYEVYRASDSRWYLGVSTWSAGLSRFATVQPISGPYQSPTARDGGTRFSYFDASGTPVPSGSADTWRIARIEARFVSEMSMTGRATASDSLVLVIALRNAR